MNKYTITGTPKAIKTTAKVAILHKAEIVSHETTKIVIKTDVANFKNISDIINEFDVLIESNEPQAATITILGENKVLGADNITIGHKSQPTKKKKQNKN